MKTRTKADSDEMRAEYDIDYSKAVRGKYYKRLIKEGAKIVVLKEGANVVVLEPDVAQEFPNSKAVNEALRSWLEVLKTARRSAARASGRAKKKRTEGQ